MLCSLHNSTAVAKADNYGPSYAYAQLYSVFIAVPVMTVNTLPLSCNHLLAIHLCCGLLMCHRLHGRRALPAVVWCVIDVVADGQRQHLIEFMWESFIMMFLWPCSPPWFRNSEYWHLSCWCSCQSLIHCRLCPVPSCFYFGNSLLSWPCFWLDLIVRFLGQHCNFHAL